MVTPHINAEVSDFAPAVLMPGDPLRAKRIAQTVLDSPRLVNDVRGMLAYTGTYEGHELTVMGSGMGQPSIAIYATELFKFFGVDRIIRVGTCGGVSPQVQVGDSVIATGAHTDSNFNQSRIPGIFFSATASFRLAAKAQEASKSVPGAVHVGPVVSKDHFYWSEPGQAEGLRDYGVLGVEMEAAALYGTAAEFGKEALAVLTVSDHLFDSSSDMSSSERESKYENTLQLDLSAALA